MKSRRTDPRRGEIRVAAPRPSPTATRQAAPTPPAPGVLIGAAIVGIGLLILGTVRSGAEPAEPAPRPTIVEATDDDYSDILGTTTTVPVVTVTTVDQDRVDAIEVKRVQMVDRASEFMVAIGSGRGSYAAAMVDDEHAAPLASLAGFYAEFRSGLRAASCDSLTVNAVSCDVFTTDPALELIGLGSTRQRVIVSFGADGGIQSFGVPAAFGSATSRLSIFARTTTPDTYGRACDIAAYGTTVVLPSALGFAATPECGSMLAGLVGSYLSQ